MKLIDERLTNRHSLITIKLIVIKVNKLLLYLYKE